MTDYSDSIQFTNDRARCARESSKFNCIFLQQTRGKSYFPGREGIHVHTVLPTIATCISLPTMIANGMKEHLLSLLECRYDPKKLRRRLKLA